MDSFDSFKNSETGDFFISHTPGWLSKRCGCADLQAAKRYLLGLITTLHFTVCAVGDFWSILIDNLTNFMACCVVKNIPVVCFNQFWWVYLALIIWYVVSQALLSMQGNLWL